MALPELGIPAIKAKVDTGARTSALHAYYLETYRSEGVERVRFGIHPLQRRSEPAIDCVADVLERRMVSDSGGHREERVVIVTPVVVGEEAWPIEITLTNRETMLFRMLLGREAIRRRALVDPGRSYRMGRALGRIYRERR